MTIQDIISLIWKRKLLLIIITLAGAFLGLTYAFIENSQSSKVSTIVEMQWNGITSGEYPDQSRFDYSNMFEAYVYQEALTSLDITNISTRQFRNAIDVRPIIESSILEMIENELRQGNQVSYFATEYKITLSNGELDLSVERGRQLLNRLLEAYKNDFINKYEQGTNISNYLLSDYENYDYIQVLRLLQAQTKMIKNAINMQLPQASQFTSTELGISFNDLLVRTENVELIYISAIQTRIANYLLTKDQDMALSTLKVQNDLLNLDLQNKDYLKTEIEGYIAAYPGSTTTVIIAGADSQPIVIDTYLNSLYSQLISVQNSIASITQEINYNQMMIDRYEGNDPNFSVTLSTQDAQKALVEVDIEQSHDYLESITEDLDIMLKEYRAFSNRLLVRPLVSPQYESSVNYILFILIGIVIGGAVGLVTLFTLENNANKKVTKQS